MNLKSQSDRLFMNKTNYKFSNSIKNIKDSTINKSHLKKMLLANNHSKSKNNNLILFINKRNKKQLKNALLNKNDDSMNNNNNNFINQTDFESLNKRNIYIHSAKNKISLSNNINKRMIDYKVNNIVNNLLLDKIIKESEKNQKQIKQIKNKETPIAFSLNKTIDHRKIIDRNMKEEPYNKKLFYSINDQVKKFLNFIFPNFFT